MAHTRSGARTRAERQLGASLASNTRWANVQDRTAETAKPRAGLQQKFLDEAGGDPVRAENFRRAYYARLTQKSLMARRKAKEQSELAEAAEQELRDAGGEA
jgi:hypothetical protein